MIAPTVDPAIVAALRSRDVKQISAALEALITKYNGEARKTAIATHIDQKTACTNSTSKPTK
jgi:hypothetical protein